MSTLIHGFSCLRGGRPDAPAPPPGPHPGVAFMPFTDAGVSEAGAPHEGEDPKGCLPAVVRMTCSSLADQVVVLVHRRVPVSLPHHLPPSPRLRFHPRPGLEDCERAIGATE